MVEEFISEATKWVVCYFKTESVGNEVEDHYAVYDFLKGRFGFLFETIDEVLENGE